MTIYSVGTTALHGISAGADGNLWFAAGNHSIDRITTTGAVTKYTAPSIDKPTGITAGPDRALWFTNEGNNSIGRITTAGVVSDYTDPTINMPSAIAAGPDGNLWFTNSAGGAGCSTLTAPCGSIGSITTAGVVSDYTDPTINMPSAIAAGPDGNLWFTNSAGGAGCSGAGPCGSIGSITTTGVVSNYTDASIGKPMGIAAGSDGALWFTNYQATNGIGRITTAGTVSSFASASAAKSIAGGPDGALWFTTASKTLGRMTTAGRYHGYATNGLGGGNGTGNQITAGPDKRMWFTVFGKVAAITT